MNPICTGGRRQSAQLPGSTDGRARTVPPATAGSAYPFTVGLRGRSTAPAPGRGSVAGGGVLVWSGMQLVTSFPA